MVTTADRVREAYLYFDTRFQAVEAAPSGARPRWNSTDLEQIQLFALAAWFGRTDRPRPHRGSKLVPDRCLQPASGGSRRDPRPRTESAVAAMTARSLAAFLSVSLAGFGVAWFFGRSA